VLVALGPMLRTSRMAALEAHSNRPTPPFGLAQLPG
jgi:hypothetical protein